MSPLPDLPGDLQKSGLQIHSERLLLSGSVFFGGKAMKRQQSEDIDALCDDWSERWQCEEQPNLVQFAASISPELREAALKYLIPVDVQQRRQCQPELSAAEYAVRASRSTVG